jgi:hypothetical protein
MPTVVQAFRERGRERRIKRKQAMGKDLMGFPTRKGLRPMKFFR